MSNTNQTVQPQREARGLKFLIYEVEGSYYLCSQKDADQLHGYRTADLHLRFHKYMYKTQILMTWLL